MSFFASQMKCSLSKTTKLLLDILALFKTTVPCATLAASYFLLSDVETERRVDDESPSGFEAY